MANPIWTDAYLNELALEAERDIARETSRLFYRFSLAVTNAVPTYTLPTYIREIVQVSWKGRRLLSFHQEDAINFNKLYRTENGEPNYYLRSSDGMQTIRFVPVPNETIAASSSDTLLDLSTELDDRVVISCYRRTDETATFVQLPDYLARRTIKAYVLWKAFAKEGKGQNLRAAKYYENKYRSLIVLATRVRSNLTRRIQRLYDIRELNVRPRPKLADNFTISRPIMKLYAVANDSFTFTDTVGTAVA